MYKCDLEVIIKICLSCDLVQYLSFLTWFFMSLREERYSFLVNTC